eukprot:TRINITY_DN10490_c0_g1_i1.p1 TRINITY_DN10490_c0_g1~~TRINITY_DN10490_c0_g1_i1.p1  ORF type:complete len:240 (-),score=33.48 TRINITY_DN10490_c0_g1_i1:30-749(-)
MGTTLSKAVSLFQVASPLTKAGVIDLSVQWGAFAVAAILQTEKFYDLAGGTTFVLLSLLSLNWGNHFFLRQKIVTGQIVIWGLRLSLFLFSRILRDGKDSRFDRIRTKPKIFFIYWTVQALWVYLTLLPVLILNDNSNNPPIDIVDKIGWGLWGAGFLLESVADAQKTIFKSNPNNHNRWIQSGLWKFSRHPNYFGEILVWIGVFLSSSRTMTGYQYLSVVSPFFYFIFVDKGKWYSSP